MECKVFDPRIDISDMRDQGLSPGSRSAKFGIPRNMFRPSVCSLIPPATVVFDNLTL